MSLFNIDSPEERAKTRQSVLHSAYDALSSRNSGLQNFPVFLEECLEKRVWEQHRTLGSGRSVEPTSFYDFVHQPFPVGLGTTYEAIEAIIAGRDALCTQWEKLSGRSVGGVKKALLPLEEVHTQGDTQSRAALNEDTVAEYAERYTEGVAMPAVVVFYDGKTNWLADGFHRCAGAEKAGKDSIVAEVHQGTRRDAILYSVGANAKHGLRRTNADKRRAVEMLLRDEEWSAKSDRWIAERCGVGHVLVNSMRKELFTENSSAPRLGQDGKKRKLPERNPEPVPEFTPVESEAAPASSPAPEWHGSSGFDASGELRGIQVEAREDSAQSDAVRRAMGIVRRMTDAELYEFEERFNELLAGRKR